MRALVCIIAVPGVLLVACGDSEDPVLAELSWSVRCAEDSSCSVGTTCLGPDSRREIRQFHGEEVCPEGADRFEPLRALCELNPGDGRVSMRLIGTVARGGEEQYGIEVTGLVVDPETDSVLEPARCNVAVLEDGARYDVGSCGEQPPSSEQPCYISNLNVERDRPEVSFRMQCENLLATTGIGIDVSGLSSAEASLRFSNCTRL